MAIVKSLSKDSSAIVKSSQTYSATMLALDLASAVLKVELTKPEVQYWKEILLPYPAPAIDYAFREFLRTAIFFPKPPEILALADGWMRKERDRAAEEKQREEKAETERRRARGETFGWAQVLTQFKGIFDKMAMPSALPRRRVLRRAKEVVRPISEAQRVEHVKRVRNQAAQLKARQA